MMNQQRCQWSTLLSIGISLVLLIPLLCNLTYAGTFEIFPLDSKPYGMTYGDWSTKFWQWYMKIPSIPGPHPADDSSGAACNKSQEGPMWFLAGSAGSKQTRSCVVPYGKALLLSPINVECSIAENPTLKTEAELRSCAKEDQDQVNSLKLIIDGVSLSNVSKYRVASPFFNYTLPENNNLGLDPQVTQVVSDGYWIILKPLAKGNHTIQSTGAAIDPTGVYSFASDVTWHITIK
jgi:hypothetical protein